MSSENGTQEAAFEITEAQRELVRTEIRNTPKARGGEIADRVFALHGVRVHPILIGREKSKLFPKRKKRKVREEVAEETTAEVEPAMNIYPPTTDGVRFVCYVYLAPAAAAAAIAAVTTAVVRDAIRPMAAPGGSDC